MANSRQPMSGLMSVKRDFSSTALPSASYDTSVTKSDSDAIPWLPTPPATAKLPAATLSAASQRLKDIQDALAGNIVSSEKALASSQQARIASVLQKRPSISEDTLANPPVKRRQLPSRWNEPEVKNTSTVRPFGSTRSTNTNTLVVPAATRSNSGKVLLSAEQTHILKLAVDGHSLFYTGSAGTGKSVLLREIIAALRRKHSRSPDAVAITASTGIAACNIGGVTIHSFAGIGLGREDAEQLATRIRKNKKASARWLRTQVLIIDEVSMVEGELFDKLARIGSLMRKKSEPFGGIQVIVTGDFFQLPPVTKGGKVNFAFEAEMWNETIRNTFKLTKVFRQRDQDFVDMLNEMRFGRLSARSVEKFKRLDREIIYEDGVAAAELFPRREDVDRSNAMRMHNLGTEVRTFTSFDGGTLQDDQQREKMLSNFMVPRALTLKVGAQVMLIKNLDETLVNGSMGKILRFADPADPEALSDASSGDSKSSKPLSASKPLSKTGGKEAKLANSGQLMPVVDFLLPGGGMRRHVVMPEVFKVELPNGEVQVSRSQLPLILAWAMSIHKSQGQTLERVKVDLARVFEKGQAYVALSRATTLDGLQVKNFDPAKVLAHPTVVEWTKTLATVPSA